jgi:dolichol-phosphate mannosyltransferase
VIDKLSMYTFEIIFVDDWSSDTTWEHILKISKKDKRIRWIRLSRNFGKEVAISAGIDIAVWDAVITLDADGQHPVDKLWLFLEEWQKWYEIVYNQRPDTLWATWIKKLSSILYYKIFNAFSEFKLEPWTTDYRLMDRKMVDYFLKFREKNRMYRGLVDRLWFSKKALIFNAIERVDHGTSSYSYGKLFKLAMNSVTSFSLFPLKLVWYFGLVVVCISVVLMLFMFRNIVFQWNTMQFNNTSALVVCSIFLSWLTLASLGMIALYIANIHEEVMERPLYIVKEKIGDGK